MSPMDWPAIDRFHWKACAWILNGFCPCDCGGEDYVRRMEARHEYIVENNQREAIVEMSDHGIIQWGNK